MIEIDSEKELGKSVWAAWHDDDDDDDMYKYECVCICVVKHKYIHIYIYIYIYMISKNFNSIHRTNEVPTFYLQAINGNCWDHYTETNNFKGDCEKNYSQGKLFLMVEFIESLKKMFIYIYIYIYIRMFIQTYIK